MILETTPIIRVHVFFFWFWQRIYNSLFSLLHYQNDFVTSIIASSNLSRSAATPKPTPKSLPVGLVVSHSLQARPENVSARSVTGMAPNGRIGEQGPVEASQTDFQKSHFLQEVHLSQSSWM